ncbi:hypothetical protein P879_11450 [Paragonimus westermani]|uniref:Uncharacterized protein n=1 Tax=Paragonimus westermani TaxID=34504 RepID=A0A8T0DAB5_9TREM|nr:hypothetical protein P879_11450 [Paragonimus westermani]
MGVDSGLPFRNPRSLLAYFLQGTFCVNRWHFFARSNFSDLFILFCE